MKSEDFGQTHSADLSIQHVTAVKINPYAEGGKREEEVKDDNWLSVQSRRIQIGLKSNPENSFAPYHAVVQSLGLG